MASVEISFTNENESDMYIQVEPWACVYRLGKNEGIAIIAESSDNAPRITIEERGNERYLTFLDSTEFFVVVGGRRVHHTEFPTNFDRL